MLTERQAAGLVHRAVVSGGWRGRRAANRLRASVIAGDPAATRALDGSPPALGAPLEAAWWLIVPDVSLPQFKTCREPDGWGGRHPFTLMVRHPEPSHLTGAMRTGVVVAAAIDHPVGEIARAKILANLDDLTDEVCDVAERHAGLAQFCRDHGISPTDLPRRARFLLMTEQLDAYRALDPDGELLAQVYAAVTPREKTRLREQVLRLGDVDRVRFLVDRNRAEEIARMDNRAVTRLGRAFADEEDWPALWRLATDVSIVAAARLAPLFPAFWQPSDPAGRGLFHALRRSVPERLAAARDEPTLLRPIYAGETVVGTSVSPDGSRLVIARLEDSARDTPSRMRVGEYDLAKGDRLRDWVWADTPGDVRVAHCGAAGVVCGDERRGLVRYRGRAADQLTRAHVLRLVSAAGNVAAWTPDGVLVGAAHRMALPLVPDAELGLGHVRGSGFRLSAAASADGCRFAFAAYRRFVVLDAAGAVVARSRLLDSPIKGITFLGPTELVTSHGMGKHPIRMWQLGNGRAVDHLVKGKFWRYADVVGLPGVRRVVARYECGSGYLLDVLDADTLVSLKEERAVVRDRTVRVVAPAGASTFVVAGGRDAGVVMVHDLRRVALRRLLKRSVVTMRPDDLDAAAALAASFGDDPVVRVVHAALAARFGREVSLGAVRARPDDIAIADGDDGGAT